MELDWIGLAKKEKKNGNRFTNRKLGEMFSKGVSIRSHYTSCIIRVLERTCGLKLYLESFLSLTSI